MIIADITRAFSGSEQNLVQQAVTRAFANRTEAVLVFNEAQRSRIQLASTLRQHPLHGWLNGDQVATAIREQVLLPAVSKTENEQIELISFHPAVLNMPMMLPAEVGCRVSVLHWKSIVATIGSNAAPVQYSTTTLDQAAAILVQALQAFPRGLPQTGLRDAVVGISPELDKKRGGPPIGQIVKHAHSKGLVDVAPLGHVNPLVRLAEHQVPAAQHSSCNPAEEPPPMPVGDATGLGADSVSPPDRVNPETQPSRLTQFLNQLRKGELGPFSRHRAALFDEIEQLVRNGALTASRVIKKSARSVVRGEGRKFPHSAVEKFLLALGARCPMFVGDKGEILDPNSPLSFGRVATAMAPNWRDNAEAELILYLVESMGDVHASDLETVAYALFPTLDEDQRLDRTEQLVLKLVSDGRLSHAEGKFAAAKGQLPKLSIVARSDSPSGDEVPRVQSA